MLKIYLALRSARRRFNNMYGEQQRQQSRSQYRGRRTKIITRDVGEYVEFEDLPEKIESTATTAFYTETSQIEDAEWEEL